MEPTSGDRHYEKFQSLQMGDMFVTEVRSWLWEPLSDVLCLLQSADRCSKLVQRVQWDAALACKNAMVQREV